MKFKPLTVALYTSLLFAGLDLVWSMVVALGLGQTYLDWILKLQFIQNPYVVMPFNLGTMITLLMVTFGVGFVLGWVGTICWNKMAEK
ncbi:MAG: hypothetical protein ABSA43_00850 [Candidatus Microgenomates bacterium]|jgi:hypothetical protein